MVDFTKVSTYIDVVHALQLLNKIAVIIKNVVLKYFFLYTNNIRIMVRVESSYLMLEDVISEVFCVEKDVHIVLTI